MTEPSPSHIEKTFRCQNVYCNVFNRNGMRTAAVSVSYKDGDEWKFGSSFGAKDLIVAADLMKKAAAKDPAIRVLFNLNLFLKRR